jgi:beta-xylosidase
MDTLFSDSFNRASLDLAWQFRRVPDASRYSLEERAGYLRLYSADTDIDHRHQYAFVGIPQTESDFTYRIHMDFAATQDSARAGIAMIQKDDTYITFTIAYRNHTPHLQLTTKQRLSPPQVVMSQPLPAFKGSITLEVTSDANTYSFSYALADGLSHHFAETPADILLSEGYTGAYLGLYVYDGVSGSSTYADFDGVQYVGHPR